MLGRLLKRMLRPFCWKRVSSRKYRNVQVKPGRSGRYWSDLYQHHDVYVNTVTGERYDDYWF